MSCLDFVSHLSETKWAIDDLSQMLQELVDLYESNLLKSFISEVVTLDQVSKVYESLEKGKIVGKVIVKLEEEKNVHKKQKLH